MRVVFEGSGSNPLLGLLVHGGQGLELNDGALRRPSYQTPLIL